MAGGLQHRVPEQLCRDNDRAIGEVQVKRPARFAALKGPPDPVLETYPESVVFQRANQAP